VRTRVVLVVLFALLVGCGAPRVRPVVPKGAIDICENCVGQVEEYSVGVSNIWDRELAGPDGVTKKQPAGQLSIWKEGEEVRHETVVVGTKLTIAGVVYEVVVIDNPKGDPGSIALLRAKTP